MKKRIQIILFLFIICFTIFLYKNPEYYGDIKSPSQLNYIFNTYVPMFQEYNIPVNIFYGTLLGYVRENNFIENDDDIDIILPVQDREKVLKLISDKKLQVNILNEYFIQILTNNVGPFDIYFYTDIDDSIHFPWDGNKFEKKMIFPLKKKKWKNYTIYIPNKSKDVCKFYYGSDWKIPKNTKIR